MSDKEIIDKLIDLTDGTIDHFDREDAMDMLYEVKRLIGKREESSFCQTVLEKIKAEIEQNAYPIVHGVNSHELGMTLYGILQVIDKYMEESEEKE